MYDYASILFNGGCNAKCPTCIGKRKEFNELGGNLTNFPLKEIEPFLERAQDEGVQYISFSGIFADPQQYQHETRLIQQVRRRLPNATLALHTNGLLALDRNLEFNSYDQATISFPSFNPGTYRKMMGVKQIGLGEIVRRTKIPIKLSVLLTKYNKDEIKDFLKKANNLGIKRITLRKLVGLEDRIPIFENEQIKKVIFNNPVYQFGDVEVTVWDYTKSTVRGLYLFPDGTLRDYFIEHQEKI